MIGAALGFSLAALFLSIIAAVAAGWALIDVQAFRRSTHQVQYVPIDEVAAKKEQEALNKQYADIAQDSWDNLGTVDPKDQNI